MRGLAKLDQIRPVLQQLIIMGPTHPVALYWHYRGIHAHLAEIGRLYIHVSRSTRWTTSASSNAEVAGGCGCTMDHDVSRGNRLTQRSRS